MIKKVALLFVALILITSFVGCSPKREEISVPTVTEETVTEPVIEAMETEASPTEATEAVESVETTEVTKPVELIIHENITDSKTFEQILGSLVDLSLYKVTAHDDSDRTKDNYAYVLQDTTYSPNLCFDVTIEDSTQLTIPFMLSDLQKQGWTLDAESTGKIVEPNWIEICELENENGKIIEADVYNLGIENCTPEELPCYSIYTKLNLFRTNTGEVEEYTGADITICKSITKESRFEEIIAELGMPRNINFASYYEDGEYEYSSIMITYHAGKNPYPTELKFFLYGDGNVISSIEFTRELPKE